MEMESGLKDISRISGIYWHQHQFCNWSTCWSS